MSAVMVRVVDLKPGDRFIGFGPGWIIETVAYAGSHDLGGDVERQRYAVTLRNGDATRTITYAGDSRATISEAQS